MPLLLQSLRLRAADEHEASARSKLGRALILEVVSADEGAMALTSEDEPSGERTLWIGLPWQARYETLRSGPPRFQDQSWVSLAQMIRALVERTVSRHQANKCDPGLCEHRLLNAPDWEVTGVSVFAPAAWLAPDAQPCRMAPEELSSGVPTQSGDLWRVGQIALNVGPEFSGLPSAVRAVFERLVEPDPRQRFSRASEALVALDNLLSPVLPDELERATVGVSAMGLNLYSEILMEASGGSTQLQCADPLRSDPPPEPQGGATQVESAAAIETRLELLAGPPASLVEAGTEIVSAHNTRGAGPSAPVTSPTSADGEPEWGDTERVPRAREPKAATAPVLPADPCERTDLVAARKLTGAQPMAPAQPSPEVYPQGGYIRSAALAEPLDDSGTEPFDESLQIDATMSQKVLLGAAVGVVIGGLLWIVLSLG